MDTSKISLPKVDTSTLKSFYRDKGMDEVVELIEKLELIESTKVLLLQELENEKNRRHLTTRRKKAISGFCKEGISYLDNTVSFLQDSPIGSALLLVDCVIEIEEDVFSSEQ